MKKTERAILACRMAKGFSGRPGTREHGDWIDIYKLEYLAVTGTDPDELQ